MKYVLIAAALLCGSIADARPLRLRSYSAASYSESVTVVQGYSVSACASGHCGPRRAIVAPRCFGPACR
jgi:hypothetical protein